MPGDSVTRQFFSEGFNKGEVGFHCMTVRCFSARQHCRQQPWGDAAHGGDRDETSIGDYFGRRCRDPALSSHQAASETGRTPGREVSLDRHSDQ